MMDFRKLVQWYIYEVRNYRSRTRWGVLYGTQNLHYTWYPSARGSLHLMYNISITTSRNEIQVTAHVKSTWQVFYVYFFRAKCKPLSQALQEILFLILKTYWTSTYNTIYKLEGEASYCVGEIYLKLIWMLYVAFYVNKKTMHFKVHHACKIFFTYKAESDVL